MDNNYYIIFNDPDISTRLYTVNDETHIEVIPGEPRFFFSRLKNYYIDPNDYVVVTVDKIFTNETDMKFTNGNRLMARDENFILETWAACRREKAILFKSDTEELAVDYFNLIKAMTI